MITIRIGLPKSTGQLPRLVRHLGQAAMLSAGALWDPRLRRFRRPGVALQGVDVALDSAGFARMVQGDGYPWTVLEYVGVAASWPFTFWSQMDWPCEEALAPSAAEVRRRIEETAALLGGCRHEALRRRGARGGPADPMPVLQGRAPGDYRRSVGLAGEVLSGDWPGLVGVGSLCTRPVAGAEGVLEVVAAVHAALPPHVRLHLFGVKSAALVPLRHHPRIESVDSQAWGTAARRAAYDDARLLPPAERGAVCTTARKGRELYRWLSNQNERAGLPPPKELPDAGEQLRLFGRRRG